MSINESGRYTEYKFRRKFLVSFLTTLMAVTLSAIAIAGYLNEGSYGSLILCLMLSATMFFLSMNTLVRFADIIVSPDGPHRRIFGRMTRFVEWSDISVVQVIPLPRKDSLGPVHTYIFHSRKDGKKRSNAKWITFNDYKAGLVDVIAATNSCIEKYHILVEHI